MKRLINLSLALALACGLLWAMSGEAFATTQRVNPVGISSHLNRLTQREVDKQTTLMQQAGINWVRFDVPWGDIEKTRGTYDFSKYDYIVNNLNTRGMKPLFLVPQYTIPTWERIDPTNYMSTPANMQDYETFVQALAAHYKGKVSLYQIGNEPNISTFWPSGPDPTAYTPLLKAGYNGVKAADPQAKVISAGLANVSPDSFLGGMYGSGAGGYFDYLGFHPYSQPNSPDYTGSGATFSMLATLKQIMTNNGDGAKNIMATEVGWPSSTSAPGGVTPSTQASYIQRVFQKIEYEDYQYVTLACIYDFIDDGGDKTNPDDNFGLLYLSYKKKPSYTTMQQVRQDYNANFTPINP